MDFGGLSQKKHKMSARHNIAFWVFGLCNNFPYVIMLSAATHILEGQSGAGTGLILLFDILPTLFVKVTLPFYMQRWPFSTRVALVSCTCFMSFVTVAAASSLSVRLAGVACASFSSGLGEITFLSLTHYYDKSTVAAWSSGTGMAGAAGAIAYLLLVLLFSPPTVLVLMTVMPVVMMVTYVYVLHEGRWTESTKVTVERSTLMDDSEQDVGIEEAEPTTMTFKQRLALMKPLAKYMGPLFLVYYAEYSINQGLVEHAWWDDIALERKNQYVLYQAMYQTGVLISRSSTSFIRIKRIGLMSWLQCLNFVLLLIDAYIHAISHITIYCLIIFYEGLLGGATYVNAYLNITEEVPIAHREFSLSIVGVADTCGIALAGASALGLHQLLVQYSEPRH